MAFNPFDEKGIPLEQQLRSWSELNVKPYDKNSVHPYTRCRIITLNGAEFESQWFLHQFARHTGDLETRRKLALARRMEQQQQKAISALVPGDETTLEHTIGYEQVAVDLTAFLARTEPDEYAKSVLDFALLEDFDHLYRYANLMEMTEGTPAEKLVGDYTEVTIGRPTIAEHRHPFDEIRHHFDSRSADILTKLHANIIVAAEQQTMNFYMNQANRSQEHLARGLYSEIAMIEEQHVTHYESLIDPSMSWFERLVMHDYTECYLYHSFMEQEDDPRIKKMWEHHLDMEIGHLHADREMMKQQERRDPVEMLPKELPRPVFFQSNIDYVRDILARQADYNAKGTEFVPADDIPEDYRYYDYQQAVNDHEGVPSQDVITRHIERRRRDYRQELRGEHPIERFREVEAVVR
ncbi:MAG: hypothetical protein GXY33_00195 [Phycisphaerae bacterium]|mgnify:CR=1 FL=1|nr:hypothetical protein [Phycisphaerae bacterium]